MTDHASTAAAAEARVAKLEAALKRIQRLAERCEILPDTGAIRNVCRDIDVAARVALEANP